MATEETAPKVEGQENAGEAEEKKLQAVLTPEIKEKVIRQLEYYFGNNNLPRDKFLQEQIKLDDGWVPFATMIKFNRLKKICSDLNNLAESIRAATSGLLLVSEDGTKLRRNPDMPIPEDTEEHRQDVTGRTVYAKAFPLNSSLDDIQKMFDTYGDVESVFMRKDAKRKFKGSVFVTFRKLEAVETFLKEESVEFQGTALEKRYTKKDYFAEKEKEKKQVQEDKQKKKNQASNRQQTDEERYFENEMRSGAILYLNGFVGETTREDIKNMLQDHGPIAWVDFCKGDTEGWVRYDQENKAKDVLAELNKLEQINLNGAPLEARVLEGEEEAARWKKMFDDIKARVASRKNKNSRNFQKNRWGKRPCKNTRNEMKAAKIAQLVQETEADDSERKLNVAPPKQDTNEDEPPAKKMKTEAT